MAYFEEWEDNVNMYYKLKYEREKKDREDKGYELLGSEKEVNGGDDCVGDKDPGVCEHEEEYDKEAEVCENETRNVKMKPKQKLSEEEKRRRKIEKREKEKMRRQVEMSQLARETRCGLKFTGIGPNFQTNYFLHSCSEICSGTGTILPKYPWCALCTDRTLKSRSPRSIVWLSKNGLWKK